MAKEHHRERPDQRDRHRDAGDEGGAAVAQEDEHHHDDEEDGEDERALDVVDGCPDGGGLVEDDGRGDACRDGRGKLGQRRADAVDGIDDVGARFAEDDHQHGRLSVHVPGLPDVLHRVQHAGDVLEPHRSAVAIGDDQRRIILGLEDLVVRRQLGGRGPIGELALGTIGVLRRQHGADVFEAEPVGVELRGVDVDAHRRQRAAAHDHLADAVDLGKRLLQQGRRHVIEAPAAVHLGREGEDEDGRVRRIHLPILRVVGQVGGEVSAGCVDRRLHVARGAIDVPVQVELQDDGGRSEIARRCHLRHAGDAAELPLERGGDRRGHRLRAGSRQRSLHADGGEIDLGKGRHRQLRKGDRTRERDRGREQDGGDGPPDERRGEAHGDVPAAVAVPRRLARASENLRARLSKKM